MTEPEQIADTDARTEPCAICGTPTQTNYSIQAEATGGVGLVTCWVFLCAQHALQLIDGSRDHGE